MALTQDAAPVQPEAFNPYEKGQCDLSALAFCFGLAREGGQKVSVFNGEAGSHRRAR